MTPGPIEVRVPVPNNDAASKTVARIGIAGSSVRPNVISTSSRTAAPTRGSGGHRPMPEIAARVIVTHFVWAISLSNSRQRRTVARSPEARTDQDRRSPAMPPSRPLLPIVGQRFQPSGILHLKVWKGEGGDRILPTLDPAAAIRPAVLTNDGRTCQGAARHRA